MEFYEKRRTLSKGLIFFKIRQSRRREERISISSQHYDFLPPLMTNSQSAIRKNKNFRIFESTTVQILDEVAQAGIVS